MVQWLTYKDLSPPTGVTMLLSENNHWRIPPSHTDLIITSQDKHVKKLRLIRIKKKWIKLKNKMFMMVSPLKAKNYIGFASCPSSLFNYLHQVNRAFAYLSF